MKCAALLCLLAVAAAAPMAEEPRTAVSDTQYPAAVRKALDEALEERPKKTRQLFHDELPVRKARKLRGKLKKTRVEEQDDQDGDRVGEKKPDVRKGKEELGQAEGWRPMSKEALAKRLPTQARSLSSSDSDSAELPDSDSADLSDSDSGDAEPEDREAEDSYLSPLYAPAPGGLAGGYSPGYGGYGGYGPYIYIVPIVLPAAGRPPGPAAGHVVTETGHQSHHYRHVPPIYIPKGYGFHHGVHGVHHGVHGKHGGHTTVHHEDKTIIRDIEPPIFKA